MTPVRHLTEDEFAERIGVAVITVRKWRSQGKGPKFLKTGTAPGSTAPVRYRLADIEAWEQSCLVTPGAA